MSTIDQPAAVPGLVAWPEPAARAASPQRLDLVTTGWRIGALTVGLLLAAWAIAPFVLTAVDAARHHFDFFGVAGYYPMDGDQYLSWILSAQHGLIRTMYGTTECRLRSRASSGSSAAGPPAAARRGPRCWVLIAWLHPWQGETLLVVAGELILGRRLDRRFEQRQSGPSSRERVAALAAFAIAKPR